MKGNVISRSAQDSAKRKDSVRHRLTIDQISVGDVFWMGPLEQIEDGEF